jgi:hypothetical protein
MLVLFDVDDTLLDDAKATREAVDALREQWRSLFPNASLGSAGLIHCVIISNAPSAPLVPASAQRGSTAAAPIPLNRWAPTLLGSRRLQNCRLSSIRAAQQGDEGRRSRDASLWPSPLNTGTLDGPALVASPTVATDLHLGDARDGLRMILRDFQISSPPALLDRERELNHKLFPLYEAVRLDLKLRRPVAPFQKIAVSFVDATHVRELRVSSGLGICEVSVPVNVEQVLSASSDLPGLVSLVVRGLEAIAHAEGFSDPMIVAVLQRCSRSDPPCSHLLVSLTKSSPSNVRCETWFVARPGHSAVEVRLWTADWSRTLRVREAGGPLWLEDDFPVRTSRIRHNRYELLDAKRLVLAEVPLSPSHTEPG